MADQARKFGARIAELRNAKNWTGKRLVARMAELGDDSLNTNQLSRYENGGAFPNEERRERFAEALGTDLGDLYAGPIDERQAAPAESPLDALSAPASAAEVGRLEAELAELHGQLRDRRLKSGSRPTSLPRSTRSSPAGKRRR